MDGQATAPAAGTVLNAIANGMGSAFAIEEYTTATVELGSDTDDVTGEVAGEPDADTRLIETCVELALEIHGDPSLTGGHVRTESEVPMASGLKSSSSAANATILATLDALEIAGDASREDAARLGVTAARDVGVTITGAFDDASASMLGGVTVTDNSEDDLLRREPVEWDVLVWTPPEQSFSADADVERCRRIAPMADLVVDLALDGEYGRAMTVNGLAFSAALGFPAEPAVEAMPDVDGVSLSGTGPSVVAVGDRERLATVRETWAERDGSTRLLSTDNEGTRPV